MHRELVVQGKAKLKGMELIAVDIFFVFHPCCRAFTGFDTSKPVPSCHGPLMAVTVGARTFDCRVCLHDCPA
jgi:hypothetical protein